MNTMHHIRSLQSAAMDLERQLRQQRFAADCGTRNNDPIPVNVAAFDALARRTGKSGFAILIGDGDKVDILPIGGAEASVREMTEKERADIGPIVNVGPDRPHPDRTDPIHIEGPEHRKQPPERKAPPVNDAALAAKRAKLTADAKRWNAEQFARNAAIAASYKEQAAKLWKKGA